jgi:peptidoglycan/LPS O-acetylase OafA/YrhL
MTMYATRAQQSPPRPANERRSEVDRSPATQLRKRDRYIDGLRALALIWVGAYHVFGWAWLPLLFPAIGILFALAGSLIAGSLDRSSGNPWRVLKMRSTRLLPPLWILGIACIPIMLAAGWTHSATAGSPLSWRTLLFWIVPISDPPGSRLGAGWVSSLWFLRSYLWFLLLSPAALWLFRHWPKRMLAIPTAAVLMSAIGVIPPHDRSGDVILSLSMFGGCWLLGFAHHDNKIRRLRLGQALSGGVSLMVLGLTWALSHPGQLTGYDIDNIPVANTLYCLGAVLILLRLSPDLSWMDKHEILDKLTTVISSRAMTIYLWGNVAIFISGRLLASFSTTGKPFPDSGLDHLQVYLGSWLVITGCVFAFGWCEDLAARRPARINPWPRSSHDLDAMRSRKVLALPRLSSFADRTPQRLFVITSCLLGAAIVLSASALLGTNTPGRTTTGDAPSSDAVHPLAATKSSASLGHADKPALITVPSVPARKPVAQSSASRGLLTVPGLTLGAASKAGGRGSGSPVARTPRSPLRPAHLTTSRPTKPTAARSTPRALVHKPAPVPHAVAQSGSPSRNPRTVRPRTTRTRPPGSVQRTAPRTTALGTVPPAEQRTAQRAAAKVAARLAARLAAGVDPKLGH